MGYFPLFLDVTGQTCVVIGGGVVAERKVRSLMKAGAVVTVVSPSITEGLAKAVRSGTVRHIQRAYKHGDIRGYKLALVATGETAVAAQASAEANELGVPVNVADVPALSSFIAPAVVRRGELQIAISTGGASPALARALRQELEESFGVEFAALVEMLAAARRYLRDHEPRFKVRADILANLAGSAQLRQYLKRGQRGDAEALVAQHLGVEIAQLNFDASLPKASEATPVSTVDSE